MANRQVQTSAGVPRKGHQPHIDRPTSVDRQSEPLHLLAALPPSQHSQQASSSNQERMETSSKPRSAAPSTGLFWPQNRNAGTAQNRRALPLVAAPGRCPSTRSF